MGINQFIVNFVIRVRVLSWIIIKVIQYKSHTEEQQSKLPRFT
jgi:hypothetical protein